MPYIFNGDMPQFVTLNGIEYALHPKAQTDLPDCDYVQTLVANGLLTAVTPATTTTKGAK